MRYILTPAGSGGDIHPFVGIGCRLRDRGHVVVVISAEPFRELLESEGLDFVSALPAEDYRRAVSNPDLWHPRRGLGVVFRSMTEAMREAYARIAASYEPGATVLVGHTLSFPARLFEERNGAPAVTVHLSPNLFRSDYEQPALGPVRGLSRAPRWVKRSFWWLADRLFVDPHVAPELNRFRAELGLAPVSRVFHSWIHSPQAVLGLFPDWFASPQPDWPPQLRLTGFPLYDASAVRPLGEELSRFLERGDPPIAFAAGTENYHAARFFETAVAAAARIGRRAVLLTKDRGQVPASLPRNVLHVRYAPFSQLFPRCAAAVHHGGIGTIAQGLAAGVPQLMMPMGFDQPDNAARAERLGVARWVAPRRFTPENVARLLSELLTDGSVGGQCARYRELAGREDALANACDFLESFSARLPASEPRGRTLLR